MDDRLTKHATREIIEDFAEAINARKQNTAKPSFEVINFRHWTTINREERVYEVETELLRFRKDNGRIASDVLSYERNRGPLLEKSEETQNCLREFLLKKDPEKTNELINSIRHSGQRQAAIITTDGFLINGNRRKMALEKLYEETREDQYRYMKVVILPGKNDSDKGGPPTLKEIEQIENRYQLQSEGKAEYYNFDRALSMRRKIELGITLEDQLKDDPNYTKLTAKELQKVIRKYQDEFIEPLKCIDRYLDQLGRSGLYHSISTGMSDREGRWQAFLDYSNYVKKKLDDEYQRMKIGIDEDERGHVEEFAFKIIRKREFPGLPKVHKIMRDIPKWIKNTEAKKELFKLVDIDLELPEKDCYDEDGNEYDERKKDQLWNAKHQTFLIKQVKRAHQIVQQEKERETPLTLLEAALKKLEHENMDPTAINMTDIPKAMELAKKVKVAANFLESEFYHLGKGLKKKKNNFNKA